MPAGIRRGSFPRGEVGPKAPQLPENPHQERDGGFVGFSAVQQLFRRAYHHLRVGAPARIGRFSGRWFRGSSHNSLHRVMPQNARPARAPWQSGPGVKAPAGRMSANSRSPNRPPAYSHRQDRRDHHETSAYRGRIDGDASIVRLHDLLPVSADPANHHGSVLAALSRHGIPPRNNPSPPSASPFRAGPL